MAIRIGVGFGGWPFADRDPERLWEYVDAAESLDIDSILAQRQDRVIGPEHGAAHRPLFYGSPDYEDEVRHQRPCPATPESNNPR